MNRVEFFNTVKSEDLHFNLLFKKPHNDIFSYGCYEDGGNYIVFETDERASPYLTWTFKSESEALDFLLSRLRDKKIIDSF